MLWDPGPEGGASGERWTQLRTENLFPLCSYRFKTPTGVGAMGEPGLALLLSQLIQWLGACALQEQGSPSSSSTKRGYEALIHTVPWRLLLSVNVCTWETMAQQMRGNLFPVRAKHRPFPNSSQQLASATFLLLRFPVLWRSRRKGAQGALYASCKGRLAEEGFATGHGGIHGRTVPGAAFQTPKTRLEQGKAPAPPCAISGAV